MGLFVYLEYIPWQAGASILVAIFILITVVGMFIVRKCVSLDTLKAHHDVAGFVFTNLGALYAVLLGFTVVNAQTRFDKINENVRLEAGYLAQLYRDAEVFNQSDKDTIRQTIRNYVRSVVHDEWPAMANGEPSDKTSYLLNDVWRAYYATRPADEKELAWYSTSISTLNSLVNARLTRLIGSRESLGAEMWTLLLLGGVVMMSFNWFFGLERFVAHLLIASVLAASTAFLLFLIYSLDTAFLGRISIEPEAFDKILNSFETHRYSK